jgi:hypothetical protein
LALETKSRIWLTLLFGLAIRLGLAPWTEERFDMYVWRLMGAYIYVYHLNPFLEWDTVNLPADSELLLPTVVAPNHNRTLPSLVAE